MKSIIKVTGKFLGIVFFIIGVFHTAFNLVPNFYLDLYYRSLSSDPRINKVELVGTEFGGSDRFGHCFCLFGEDIAYQAIDLQINEGIPSYVQVLSSEAFDDVSLTVNLSTPTLPGYQRLGYLSNQEPQNRELLRTTYNSIYDAITDYSHVFVNWVPLSVSRIQGDLLVILGYAPEDVKEWINGPDVYDFGVFDTSTSTFLWSKKILGNDAKDLLQIVVMEDDFAVIYKTKIEVYSMDGELHSLLEPFSSYGTIKYEQGLLWNFIEEFDEEGTLVHHQVETINHSRGLKNVLYTSSEGVVFKDGTYALNRLYLAGYIEQNSQRDALILILDPTNNSLIDQIDIGGSQDDWFTEIEVNDQAIYTLGTTASYDTSYFYDPYLALPLIPFLGSRHYEQDFFMAIENINS